MERVVQIELIEGSLQQLGRQRKAFVEAFYYSFLNSHPAIVSYFARTDMQSQQRKLLFALMTIVDSLHDDDDLKHTLQQLAEMHRGMRIEPQHYDLFRAALIKTLPQFLPDIWTDDHEIAWNAAFSRIIDMMLTY